MFDSSGSPGRKGNRPAEAKLVARATAPEDAGEESAEVGHDATRMGPIVVKWHGEKAGGKANLMVNPVFASWREVVCSSATCSGMEKTS
jgi:hypothetical protein